MMTRLLLFVFSSIQLLLGLNSIVQNANESEYVRRDHKDSVIVFVHGVLGDAQASWTDSTTKAYWPTLMENDAFFKGFDIYVYRYPSHLVESSYTIDELVEDLRRNLASDEIFLKHKKVFFLCHSMGGLVVRAFLTRYPKYASQVPMIYFFSTPTTGAQSAKWATLVARNPQIKGMLPTDENEYLASVQKGWLAAQFPIASYCGYETRDTYGIRVVDQASATNLCNRHLDPIDANHFDIVKPSDVKAASYISFRTAVQEILNEEKATGKPAPAKAPQPPNPSPKPQPPQSPMFQAPYGNLAARCVELGNAIISGSEERNQLRPDQRLHHEEYKNWYEENDGLFFHAHFYSYVANIHKELLAVHVDDPRLDELIEKHERYFESRQRDIQAAIDFPEAFHLSIEEIREIGERLKVLATQIPAAPTSPGRTGEQHGTSDTIEAQPERHGTLDTVKVKSDVTMRFIYARSPALVLVNPSEKMAENIKWAVEVWNMDLPGRNDPLPIPVQTFDFIRPHNEGGAQSIFSASITAGLVKPGNRLFGSASVDCPDCVQGHTYIVYIVWGEGGWFSEVPDEKLGRLITPRDFSAVTRAEYFKSLEVMAKAVSRMPIQ
jgi:pimeloyl-ACP methyl ester carboxylesterase